MLTVDQYENLLRDGDFINVKAEDKTDMFMHYLNKELSEFQNVREEFVREFSQGDFDYICQGWQEKIVRTKDGHQKWGAFYAEKKNL